MGGAAKKNLRVFREICGDKNLGHVRIVTTNWNQADEKQKNARQDALAKGAFEPLIKEGAELCRHDKGIESAQLIISQLIHQTPVKMKIHEELNEGRTLGDTSAGAMIIEEMKELKEKHDKEVEGLKKEMEEAVIANDEDLRAELAEEHRKLEEMMARAEEDRKTLEKTRTTRETQLMVVADKEKARRDNSDQERRAWETATTSTAESNIWVGERPRRQMRERDGDRAIATLGLVATGATVVAVAGGVVVAAAGAGVAVMAVAGAMALDLIQNA